jgi:hypothetical protein
VGVNCWIDGREGETNKDIVPMITRASAGSVWEKSCWEIVFVVNELLNELFEELLRPVCLSFCWFHLGEKREKVVDRIVVIVVKEFLNDLFEEWLRPVCLRVVRTFLSSHRL